MKELPDAAVHAHLVHAAKLPSVLSGMQLYPVDGAVHRQKEDAAAWGYRDAARSLVVFGVDPDPAKAPALKSEAQASLTNKPKYIPLGAEFGGLCLVAQAVA